MSVNDSTLGVDTIPNQLETSVLCSRLAHNIDFRNIGSLTTHLFIHLIISLSISHLSYQPINPSKAQESPSVASLEQDILVTTHERQDWRKSSFAGVEQSRIYWIPTLNVEGFHHQKKTDCHHFKQQSPLAPPTIEANFKQEITSKCPLHAAEQPPLRSQRRSTMAYVTPRLPSPRKIEASRVTSRNWPTN